MSNTLNLFPARVPIGTVQPDGTVLMTPEFMRAMRALFERVGGPDGMGSDDLAVVMSGMANIDSAQSQAIEDIGAVASAHWDGQVAALLAEVQELRSHAHQIDILRAELAEVRKELEGVELLATHRDPYRVDLTRPGPIGSLTPSTGAFTTLSASGQITSTLATGTAPFSITSTTVVPNLNVSQLLGGTWAIPGTIGSTTPNTGAFTTISATGQITSTLATGTAPFSITSTTVVPNLNVSQLLGGTWAIPGAIGATTPNTGRFTTVGVGTSSPTYKLVVSNSGAQGIEFDSDGAAYGAGTTGILSYNRSGSAYVALNIDGLAVNLRASGTVRLTVDGTGIGFYGTTPVAKPTVTGSRGGNAALASLLTGLASQGLVTDSSTA